jgi:hypothetical protein
MPRCEIIEPIFHTTRSGPLPQRGRAGEWETVRSFSATFFSREAPTLALPRWGRELVNDNVGNFFNSKQAASLH